MSWQVSNKYLKSVTCDICCARVLELSNKIPEAGLEWHSKNLEAFEKTFLKSSGWSIVDGKDCCHKCKNDGTLEKILMWESVLEEDKRPNNLSTLLLSGETQKIDDTQIEIETPSQVANRQIIEAEIVDA